MALELTKRQKNTAYKDQIPQTTDKPQLQNPSSTREKDYSIKKQNPSNNLFS